MTTLSLHPSGHAIRWPGRQLEQQAKLKLTITALFTYCDSASQEVKKKKKVATAPQCSISPHETAPGESGECDTDGRTHLIS